MFVCASDFERDRFLAIVQVQYVLAALVDRLPQLRVLRIHVRIHVEEARYADGDAHAGAPAGHPAQLARGSKRGGGAIVRSDGAHGRLQVGAHAGDSQLHVRPHTRHDGWLGPKLGRPRVRSPRRRCEGFRGMKGRRERRMVLVRVVKPRTRAQDGQEQGAAHAEACEHSAHNGQNGRRRHPVRRCGLNRQAR
ncbi:hypothetical protein H257_02830 [Aphanomyces astaci]|uniref:Uncharacterized protein n=1 Tax=Aphanomyces astaci TaxID=112090 RepID=W4H0Y9_APHAT|nr:hypothetical protein H257_02830 [Aphanomyces astaci]ETV84934.1 hypothetical protein H257_02830 [Aphanomyces astaci]|eukprot:XP_009824952.1 hypothetical protein H257_02830 [Aphanomyces astaci]